MQLAVDAVLATMIPVLPAVSVLPLHGAGIFTGNRAYIRVTNQKSDANLIRHSIFRYLYATVLTKIGGNYV
jgi:hypothetical protein